MYFISVLIWLKRVHHASTRRELLTHQKIPCRDRFNVYEFQVIFLQIAREVSIGEERDILHYCFDSSDFSAPDGHRTLQASPCCRTLVLHQTRERSITLEGGSTISVWFASPTILKLRTTKIEAAQSDCRGQYEKRYSLTE